YYTSQVPSAPKTAPPAPARTSSSGSTTSLDGEIDAMLAASGGRLSSRAMRQLELKMSGSNQAPSSPPASSTQQKRDAIMSRIPKTKTRDSEGGDLSFAAKDDAPLAGKQLVSKYQGEDKGVTWRAGDKETVAARWGLDVDSPEFAQRWEERRNSDRMTTHYDTTERERERSRLKEKGNGKVKTTHKTRHGPEHGHTGWVMDPDSGNVHTFDPLRTTKHGGKTQTTHHSSPLAGKPVAGAGMMKFEDKHISEITDESGHYRPEGEYTYQAVKQMASRGLLDRTASEDEVDFHEAGPGNLSAKVSLAGFKENDPRQQKGWLEHEQGIDKDELTLPYQAFLQTRGNERQARAKKSTLQELTQKTPKVGEDPGAKALRKAGSGASSLSSSGNGSPARISQGQYIDFDQVPQSDTGGSPPQGQYITDLDQDQQSDSDSSPPQGQYITDLDQDEQRPPPVAASYYVLDENGRHEG
ncbi:MAG: hypothetical protein ACLFRV_15175, partial [Acidimicrobiales bacterium]